jgi:branched-chain amino acid transport system permease protein
VAYLRTHTLPRHLLLAVLAALLLLLLTYLLPPYRNYQLATAGAYVCATAGLTVLVGLTGQLSLGHGALMATGAYAYALVSDKLVDGGTTGIPLLLVSLVAAILATMVVGFVLGLAGARLHGPYLAGLTLTLVIVVPAITTTFAGTLGGDQGLSVTVDPPPVGLGAAFPFERWQAWITLTAAILTVFFLANVVRGRPGRQMRAIRDDEVAARLSGIDVARVKVGAFVLSAATAGLGGGLLAVLTQSVAPGAFSLTFSLFLLMAVVIGGLGSLAGAVWGAILIVVLPDLADSLAEALPVSSDLAERLDGNLAIGVFGLIVIGVMLAVPGGIQGLLMALVRRLRGRRPAASGPADAGPVDPVASGADPGRPAPPAADAGAGRPEASDPTRPEPAADPARPRTPSSGSPSTTTE